MRMSPSSYESMNELAALCFNANAVVDNLAYSLSYHYFNKIADVVHHHVAHMMPAWADLVTDKMLVLGGRPVRKDIGGYEKDYEKPEDAFEALVALMLNMRQATRTLIEAADLDGDDEVRIFAEEFLGLVEPFVKQADEWLEVSKHMDPYTLNVHIEDYTSFISHEEEA